VVVGRIVEAFHKLYLVLFVHYTPSYRVLLCFTSCISIFIEILSSGLPIILLVGPFFMESALSTPNKVPAFAGRCSERIYPYNRRQNAVPCPIDLSVVNTSIGLNRGTTF
jgi:hypothetical protein